MGFKDCIKGKFKKGKLNKRQIEKIKKDYDTEFKSQKDLGRSDIEADIKAQEVVNNQLKYTEQNTRNKVRAAIHQKKVINDIEKRAKDEGITTTKATSDFYQQTAWRKESIKAETLSFLNKIGNALSGGFFNITKDYNKFMNAIRHMSGKKIDDQDAKILGESMKQAFDYLASRYRAAGGDLGEITNYFPQRHMKEAIKKVSESEWMSYVFERLDREKMINRKTGKLLTDDEIDKTLRYVYQDIITDGAHSLKKKFELGEEIFGVGDVDKKRSMSRFIHFKDMDSFLEYNAKFGVGDEGLIQAFLSSIDGMANDIAMLEKMGPRPDALARKLDTLMQINDGKGFKQGWVRGQYNILRGEHKYGNPDSIWWKILTGTQNVMRSAMLGSASLSAISDTAFIATTAKINGLSATKALKNYTKIMTGDSALRGLAKRTGYLVDVVNGAALADTRFAGEMSNSGITGWMAGMTNKMSGLQRMTDSAGLGIMFEGLSTVGEQIKKGVDFNNLDVDLRASLSKFGIDKADWDSIKKAGAIDIEDGVSMVIPKELRLNDSLDAKYRNALADKLDDWVQSLKQQATNEGLLATKALTTGAAFGNGAVGSLTRAFASSLFMFKSFPITVMMTHLLPAIRRAKVQRKYDHLAMVVIPTTILGALAIQLKNTVKGKSTEDMNSAAFWNAAFLQGGGLGLFGDFFLGDYSRFGRNPVTELTGPMGGFVADILGATKGNFDKSMEGKELKNFKRDVFRLLKRNMPMQNLWYTRLLLERTLFDNIERMLDPNFDKRIRRYEKRLAEERGQEFWWGPRKEPDLSKLVSSK